MNNHYKKAVPNDWNGRMSLMFYTVIVSATLLQKNCFDFSA